MLQVMLAPAGGELQLQDPLRPPGWQTSQHLLSLPLLL